MGQDPGEKRVWGISQHCRDPDERGGGGVGIGLSGTEPHCLRPCLPQPTGLQSLPPVLAALATSRN